MQRKISYLSGEIHYRNFLTKPNDHCEIRT